LKTATLIYNPVAGRHPARREKQIREIAAVLRARSIDARLAPTTRPGTAAELARAAVRQGNELILACGGDGTLNEVINGITPGNVTLGILPGGTANIAAKELNLPHDPVRAARQLSTWSPRRIAIGLATWWPRLVGGTPSRRYFLSIAGIGFDAYVIHRLSAGFKMSAGVIAYIVEAIRQAWRYPFPPFRCRVEGREFEASFAVAHRTNRYAGWLRLAPGANLFEPRLSLCLFRSSHWARYVLYAAAVLARQHLRLGDVELVEGRQIECAASKPGASIYFELDGELVGQLPASFEVVPAALTLLVP
jgi:YegS/Rv2252/BmrU family lipid kinase